MSDGKALMKWLPAAIAAGILALFALFGSTLVGLSYQGTAERIAQNERDALLRQLGAILPASSYDNDMLADSFVISAPAQLGAEQTRVYRARKQEQRVATLFSPVIGQGYSGGISLLVGVREDGSLAGVRVLSHKETPGLGDKIEIERSRWIDGFAGLSLNQPQEADWKVKRDGGHFDQFTGATITPRAVVAAVKRTLHYYQQHRDHLFDAPAEPADE